MSETKQCSHNYFSNITQKHRLDGKLEVNFQRRPPPLQLLLGVEVPAEDVRQLGQRQHPARQLPLADGLVVGEGAPGDERLHVQYEQLFPARFNVTKLS